MSQFEGASGKQPVRVWLHNEFLVFGNLKMSRSKGNVVLVNTLKERGIDPMAYRYLLLTAHYRSKLHFTDESIAAAQNGLNNLRADLAALPALDSADPPKGWSEEAEQVRDAFHTAINDDLDLPTALSITREVARDGRIEPAERRRLILDFDRVLGLRLDTFEAKQPRAISDEARAARDWKRSDQLRDQLIALGFEVRDTPKGTELV